MPQGCAVWDCNARHGHKGEDGKLLSFFRFPDPADKQLWTKWVHACGREKFQPAQHDRVCSRHFKAEDFERDMFAELMPVNPDAKRMRGRKLKSGSIPILPPHHPAASRSSTAPPRELSLKRAERAAHREAVKEILDGVGAETDDQRPSTSGTQSQKPRREVKVRDVSETRKTTQKSPKKTPQKTPLTPEKANTDIIPSYGYRFSYMGTPRRTTLDHPYYKERPSPAQSVPESLSSSSPDQSPENSSDVPESEELADLLPPSEAEDTSSSTVEPADALEEFVPSEDEPSSTEDEEESQVPPEEDEKFLVFSSNLEELMKFCPQCGSVVTSRSKDYSGSMVKFHMECMGGCTSTWQSQPTVNRQPIGNVLIAATILFTGLTFTRVAAWASALKLNFISQTTFTAIQKSRLWPVIQEAWNEDQKEAIKEVKKRRANITLGGDSRCDSPGHCARYGSYTLMDIRPNAPSLIVAMELVHSSEVKNSHHMESEGLRRCIDKMRKSFVKVTTLATDQHPMITKMMRDEYPKINHQLDTWHLSKNIKKKLTAKAKKKGNSQLGEWIAAICNHLWYCASSCGNSAQRLKEKWLSMLHHVCNVHTWTGGVKMNRCDHGPELAAPDGHEVCYLEKDSEAFNAMKSVVSAPALLKVMPQLTKFCHTGKIEVFHNYLLKYCSKRQYFPYPGMKARLMLAALSWNELQREENDDKVKVIRYSKKRDVYVLEERRRGKHAGHVPGHLKRLLSRTLVVIKEGIVLPQIPVPDLKTRGHHLAKPTVQELLEVEDSS